MQNLRVIKAAVWFQNLGESRSTHMSLSLSKFPYQTPHSPLLCLEVTKGLKAFILHAGIWGVYKRFCFGYTTI